MDSGNVPAATIDIAHRLRADQEDAPLTALEELPKPGCERSRTEAGHACRVQMRGHQTEVVHTRRIHCRRGAVMMFRQRTPNMD